MVEAYKHSPVDQAERLSVALDRDSPIPLYHQLKQHLLQVIERGDYCPDERLPSERELQSVYGVSQITVRRALSELVVDGRIVRKPGRGTFLLPEKQRIGHERTGGLFEELESRGLHVQSEILDFGCVEAKGEIASKLGVSQGATVFHYVRLAFVEGKPLLLAETHIGGDHEIGLDPTVLAQESAVKLLGEVHGVEVVYADRTVEAVNLPEESCELLGVTPTTPMLQVESILRDREHRPVILTRAVYCGGRYKYQVSGPIRPSGAGAR